MALELFEGIVTRNTDFGLGTGMRGAIFFQCDLLLAGREWPVKADPLFMHNWFDVPEVGDLVEIEIDLAMEIPEPRWRSIIYNLQDELPEIFQTNYPKRRGIRTKAGHWLFFDDARYQETIELQHVTGTLLNINSRGDWTETVVRDKIHDVIRDVITTIGRHVNLWIKGNRTKTVDLDETNLIKRNRQTTVKLEDVVILEKSRDTTITVDDIKNIGGDEDTTTVGSNTHTAASHVIAAVGSIKVGSAGASENLVLGSAFSTLYNNHTHIGNLGISTGVPIIPMGVTELATRNFTEMV